MKYYYILPLLLASEPALARGGYNPALGYAVISILVMFPLMYMMVSAMKCWSRPIGEIGIIVPVFIVPGVIGYSQYNGVVMAVVFIGILIIPAIIETRLNWKKDDGFWDLMDLLTLGVFNFNLNMNPCKPRVDPYKENPYGEYDPKSVLKNNNTDETL